MAFILVTVMLDMVAMAIVIPVLPKLVLGFLNNDTAAAARVFGVFGTAWALMQFVFSPVQGALSDRFGRRPVILISNFGLGLDYVLMALAPGLGVLFVGRVVSGISAASVSTAGAYIADVSPPERRAAGFGLISVAFGVGFVVGPALGGMLGQLDPRLPFWVAAGLSLANGVYGLLVLPESLPRERRAAFAWRRANPVGSLRLLFAHPGLVRLGAVYALYSLAHQALPAVFVLYVDYRYGWNERTIGLTLALVGVCSALVGGVLVRPAVRRFGERRSLLAGLAFGTAGFAIFGLAPSGWLFCAGIPVMALWGLTAPAAQGLMSRRVAASEQGRLQGANSSIMGLTGLIGPTLFTAIFAHFIAPGAGWQLPGAPYLLATLLLVAALAVAAARPRDRIAAEPALDLSRPPRPQAAGTPES
ncbi:MAG: TCR/Tet family MFS transporter [Alphaproteobacteria bacterium]|nr:TCR/Tet family MFS transporter [Alphaproteobacteria bacterium]